MTDPVTTSIVLSKILPLVEEELDAIESSASTKIESIENTVQNNVSNIQSSINTGMFTVQSANIQTTESIIFSRSGEGIVTTIIPWQIIEKCSMSLSITIDGVYEIITVPFLKLQRNFQSITSLPLMIHYKSSILIKGTKIGGTGLNVDLLHYIIA
jgi:hypothetical protein